MTKKRNILRGASFIILSEFSLSIGAALTKSLSEDLSNASIVFGRNLFFLLALTPLLLNKKRNFFQTNRFPIHIARSLLGMGAIYCIFYALGNIPLADAILIKSTVPIMIPFVAAFWLQENLSRRVIFASAIGFSGVLVILNPNNQIAWASLIALAGSFFAAHSFVTVRKLSTTEPTLRIVFYYAIIGLVISAIPLIWSWQMPTLPQWLMLMGRGVASTIGQLSLTRGYQNAPASSVGIFIYTSIPFSAFWGWLFWQEKLDLNFLLGTVLIVLAGSIVLRRNYLEKNNFS